MNLEETWHEITGYSVAVFTWFYNVLPSSYEEVNIFITFLILISTFLFITLPKCWDNIKKRWKK